MHAGLTLDSPVPAARADSVQRVAPTWSGWVLLLALVVLAALRSHAGTRLDSFTVDEPWHIVAGASYVRSGDFRLNPEHPPLAKLWVGASMPRDFKLRPLTPLSEKVQERDLVEETMFYDNDPVRVQRHARIGMWSMHAMLLFSLGLLLWRSLGLAWAAPASAECLGDAAAARRAYLRPLEQTRAPVDARVRRQVEAQVTLLDAGTRLASVKPVRNPFLE